MKRVVFLLMFIVVATAINAVYYPNNTVIVVRDNPLVIADDTEFGENCVIDAREGRIRLNAKLTLGANTRLILGNYPIESDIDSVVLVGNFARLEAPIAQIFDENIHVIGDWQIERAYPQWFGAVASQTNINLECSADAINKAILLKNTGDVILPRGFYRITKPILINTGVRFIGEAPIDRTETITNSKSLGSIILCDLSQTVDSLNSEYAVLVNTTPSVYCDTVRWKFEYPEPATLLKHIQFKNISGKKTKCIYSADCAKFDGVIWYNFAQAVKFYREYIDMKQIVNCTYHCDANYSDANVYAFDFEFLGDGLVFSHNAVHDNCNAIRLSNCGGAHIFANIINANVLVESSKGVVFASNHMEEGGSLKIRTSNITTQNNYFWRNSNYPAITIEGSSNYDTPVVSMCGDMMLFYDSFNPNKSSKQLDGESTDSDFEQVEIGNTSNYCLGADICLDDNTTLSINNVYRYEYFKNSFGKMYVCGLNISQKGNSTGFEDFNNHSGQFSQHCNIISNYVIATPICEFDTIQMSVLGMPNVNIRWSGDSTAYYYRYSYEAYQNSPAGQYKDINILIGNNISKYYYRDMNDKLSILFRLDSVVPCNLKIRRKAYLSANSRLPVKTEYVIVPLSSRTMLYDNGVSIMGYRWIETNNLE